MPDESFGLIAGGGSFPFIVARAARQRGLRVACVGVRHEVSPELADEVDAFRLVGLGRLGAAIRFLRREGVRNLSWAGSIHKETLFSPRRILSLMPDWRAIRFWLFELRDRQSQTMLASAADLFEREGFHLAHSAHHCPELLAEPGLIGKKKPTKKQLEDIAFGWRIAKRMADLDVGQSVAVHERATIAVEGMEGTDRNIRRAGELCRSGFTVVKVAQAGHDMRFDVPTIGPGTIEVLREAGGKVLAIEARKTIVLEREEVARLANRSGIVVVSLEAPPDAPPDAEPGGDPDGVDPSPEPPAP